LLPHGNYTIKGYNLDTAKMYVKLGPTTIFNINVSKVQCYKCLILTLVDNYFRMSSHFLLVYRLYLK